MKSIQVRDLTKKYGDVVAVDELSCHFDQGKIYGLLGRNGAGKTTFMKMISDRLNPDGGEVYYDESNQVNDELLGQIYHVDAENLFPAAMKVKDAVHWTKVFYPAFNEESALLDLERAEIGLKKKMSKLSTGLTTMVKVILAINSGASFIMLDEPTLGLDAVSRDYLYQRIIEEYGKGGQTFVLSTHLIEEVAPLIEEVVFIDHGKLLATGNVEDLLEGYVQVSGAEAEMNSTLANKEVVSRRKIGGLHTAVIKGQANEFQNGSLTVTPVELQELFIAMTGNIRE